MERKDYLQSFKPGDPRASEAGKKSKRGVSLKRALKEMFQKEAKEGGKLTQENFVKACALAGMKGNSGMAKMIFEYIDGKVADKIEADITTKEDVNIKIID